MKPNILGYSFAMIAAILILSGCIKSPENLEEQPARTYISILYLAPTAPTVDIFFNTTKVSTAAFTPYTVTPAYNSVERGDYGISFKKITVDSVVASIPMASYDSMKYYTLLIHNQSVDGPASATRIIDDFTNLTNDKPFYRFFHTSPNIGTVDLYMDNVKIQSNRMLADNTGYDALNKFSAATTGSHTLQVKEAGTDTVIATLNFVDLLAGNAYTFYLKGLKDGTGIHELSIGVLRAN